MRKEIWKHKFLEILSEAKSNIKEFGTGKDIYLKFVKPSIISTKQAVSHWAISSLFEEYKMKRKYTAITSSLLIIEKPKKVLPPFLLAGLKFLQKLSLSSHDMIFAALHFGGEDFHCVISGFSGVYEYNKIKEDLISKFYSLPLTEVIRSLDKYFGKEYFTLKDLLLRKDARLSLFC